MDATSRKASSSSYQPSEGANQVEPWAVQSQGGGDRALETPEKSRNPSTADRDISFEDYRTSGVMAALAAINAIAPQRKVHACGYCLGGTLLSIAAATMARNGDERLASITLLAAQTDFSEPGDLMLFVDAAQVAFLEDMMWDQGFLDTRQMAAAFTALRSNELVWVESHSRIFGEREHSSDLMARSADQTRMPYRMHAQYLRALFLENRLTAGRYAVEGEVIALKDIPAPMFVVSTETDHISPWRSVYKVHLFTDNELTFVLTSGDIMPALYPNQAIPIDAIISIFVVTVIVMSAPIIGWRERGRSGGSWWPAWASWLEARSARNRIPPARIGEPSRGLVPLCPAPGSYVHQQ